ncbi:MAG: hypothetical protein K2L49_07210 [Muribaculaceae bacterium]|nr:hypothetical protein [Muribaculaceae bacterium]
MWLTSSSIGRKLIMAITGACLVLFVTFHVLMNAVAIVWPTAYNQVCEFLGANWYALIASAGLALLFVIHIIYALWLTIQNRNARGNDRYCVTSRPKGVEWSSKNMLVLGFVIIAFLVVHLIQFWYKMQWQEICGQWYTCGEATFPAAAGTLFLQLAFEQWWTPVIYIIGFICLWFHMNHGFWSMFQTAGWNNGIWLARLKKIAQAWTSVVILLFIAQAAVFYIQASRGYYYTNTELQEQYIESFRNEIQNEMMELQAEYTEAQSTGDYAKLQDIQMRAQQLQAKFESQVNTIKKLAEGFNKPATTEIVAEETEITAETEAEAPAQENSANQTNE